MTGLMIFCSVLVALATIALFLRGRFAPPRRDAREIGHNTVMAERTLATARAHRSALQRDLEKIRAGRLADED
jgi:hypothetical protein